MIEFIDHPPSSAAPERLARLLGHAVSAELVEHIQSDARGRAGLDRLLAVRFGPLPPLDFVQRFVAGLSSEQLTGLALDLGAIWHARSIACVVIGREVRELVAAIGAERRLLALKSLAFSPDLEGSGTLLPRMIAALIPADGAACLSAWCACQPSPLTARLRLKLPEGKPLENARHHRFGLRILAHLAGSGT
jgi:hypothetical protein